MVQLRTLGSELLVWTTLHMKYELQANYAQISKVMFKSI